MMEKKNPVGVIALVGGDEDVLLMIKKKTPLPSFRKGGGYSAALLSEIRTQILSPAGELEDSGLR